MCSLCQSNSIDCPFFTSSFPPSLPPSFPLFVFSPSLSSPSPSFSTLPSLPPSFALPSFPPSLPLSFYPSLPPSFPQPSLSPPLSLPSSLSLSPFITRVLSLSHKFSFPIDRHYFALATNSGEQFHVFANLAVWLLNQCGRNLDQIEEVAMGTVVELNYGLSITSVFLASL